MAVAAKTQLCSTPWSFCYQCFQPFYVKDNMRIGVTDDTKDSRRSPSIFGRNMGQKSRRPQGNCYSTDFKVQKTGSWLFVPHALFKGRFRESNPGQTLLSLPEYNRDSRKVFVGQKRFGLLTFQQESENIDTSNDIEISGEDVCREIRDL